MLLKTTISRPNHDMLLASMLGSPQVCSGVSSSALQRQIAHATCAYGFHCQFKDSSKVVPTQQCECGNRFHTQCLSLSFQDAETQVDSHVNMDQCNLDSCSLQHAGQNADEDSPAKRTREKKGALNAEHKNSGQERYERKRAMPAHVGMFGVFGR